LGIFFQKDSKRNDINWINGPHVIAGDYGSFRTGKRIFRTWREIESPTIFEDENASKTC
jgi:hypothetical protein